MTSRQQRRAAERQARKDAHRPTAPLPSAPPTRHHTLSAQQLVLPGEHAAQLEALRAELRAEYQPQTTTEELLVNELAEQYWRLRRMRGIEATILGAPADELERGFRLLPMVQRTMAAAERGFHKALKALHDLQKQRQKEQKEVGFVPQKPEQPATPVGQPLLAADARGTMPLRPTLGVMATDFQPASPRASSPRNPQTGPEIQAVVNDSPRPPSEVDNRQPCPEIKTSEATRSYALTS